MITWLQESLAGHTWDGLPLSVCALSLQETNQGVRVRVKEVPSPPGPLYPAIELGGLVQPGTLLWHHPFLDWTPTLYHSVLEAHSLSH